MRFALLLLLAAPALAQPEWRTTPTGPAVSVDVLTALGDDLTGDVIEGLDDMAPGARFEMVSTAVVVGGRVPLASGWTVVAEVPVSFSRMTARGFGTAFSGNDSFSSDGLSLGNPYVGVERRVLPSLALGGGVRVPLARYDDESTDTPGWLGGLTADPERFEAYLPEIATVSVLARFEPTLGPARLRMRLAPTVHYDTAEDFFGQDQFSRAGVVLGYSVQAETDLRPFTLSAGVVGRPILSGERYELFETSAAAVLGAQAKVGGVRPGVGVRVPLGLDDVPAPFRSDATVGFSLEVPVR